MSSLSLQEQIAQMKEDARQNSPEVYEAMLLLDQMNPEQLQEALAMAKQALAE